MRDPLPGGQCAADDAGGPQFEAAVTMSTAAVHEVSENKRGSKNLKILTINVTSWGTLKEMLIGKKLDKYEVVAVEEHKLRDSPSKCMKATIKEAVLLAKAKGWVCYFAETLLYPTLALEAAPHRLQVGLHS